MAQHRSPRLSALSLPIAVSAEVDEDEGRRHRSWEAATILAGQTEIVKQDGREQVIPPATTDVAGTVEAVGKVTVAGRLEATGGESNDVRTETGLADGRSPIRTPGSSSRYSFR